MRTTKEKTKKKTKKKEEKEEKEETVEQNIQQTKKTNRQLDHALKKQKRWIKEKNDQKVRIMKMRLGNICAKMRSYCRKKWRMMKKRRRRRKVGDTEEEVGMGMEIDMVEEEEEEDEEMENGNDIEPLERHYLMVIIQGVLELIIFVSAMTELGFHFFHQWFWLTMLILQSFWSTLLLIHHSFLRCQSWRPSQAVPGTPLFQWWLYYFRLLLIQAGMCWFVNLFRLALFVMFWQTLGFSSFDNNPFHPEHVYTESTPLRQLYWLVMVIVSYVSSLVIIVLISMITTYQKVLNDEHQYILIAQSDLVYLYHAGI